MVVLEYVPPANCIQPNRTKFSLDFVLSKHTMFAQPEFFKLCCLSFQVERTQCKNCLVWAKSDNLARDVIRQSPDITVIKNLQFIANKNPRSFSSEIVGLRL